MESDGREVSIEDGLEGDVDAVTVVWATGVAGLEGTARRTLEVS